MRTLVDIPEGELDDLNALSRARKLSRAELIRQAVAGFLAQNKAGLEDSFGLWKKRGVDGVAYQERLRREWER
jgi:metal-responsive CopG/Arc/MetJ family transcriptional regulator